MKVDLKCPVCSNIETIGLPNRWHGVVYTGCPGLGRPHDYQPWAAGRFPWIGITLNDIANPSLSCLEHRGTLFAFHGPQTLGEEYLPCPGCRQRQFNQTGAGSTIIVPNNFPVFNAATWTQMTFSRYRIIVGMYEQPLWHRYERDASSMMTIGEYS